MKKELRDYFSQMGSKGGSKTSKAKKQASLANLIKANKAKRAIIIQAIKDAKDQGTVEERFLTLFKSDTQIVSEYLKSRHDVTRRD